MGVFLIVRAAVIPKDFGKYGHYRPAALDPVRSRPIRHPRPDTRVMWHDDQAQLPASPTPKASAKSGLSRRAALDLVRSRPIGYAGQDTCVMCHDDQAKLRASG